MRTLLISLGGHDYPSAPALRHAAFAASSAAFAETLGEAGLKLVDPDDHLTLFNASASWPDQLIDVRDWLRGKIGPTQSVGNLIIHYVGHGSFKPNSSDYFLTINRTDAEDPCDTSISVAGLHRILVRNAGTIRIFFVIDACFAAAALKDLQTNAASDLVGARMAQIIADEGAGANADRGIAALCSADKFEGASARGRDGLTQFTDGLITVLRTGDASVASPMSLSGVARLLRKVLVEHYADDAIMPILHAPENSQGKISEFPLFPNCAANNVKSVLGDVPEETREKLSAVTSAFAEELAKLAGTNVTRFYQKCEEIQRMGRKEIAEAELFRTNLSIGYDVTDTVATVQRRLDRNDPARWGPATASMWWAAKFAPRRACQHLASEFSVPRRSELLDDLEHIKNEALMDHAAMGVQQERLHKTRGKLAQMAYIATQLKIALREQERTSPLVASTGENLWGRPNLFLDEVTQDILTSLTDLDRFNAELNGAKDHAYRRVRPFDASLSKATATLARIARLAEEGARAGRSGSIKFLNDISAEIATLRGLVDEMMPLAKSGLVGEAGPRRIPVPRDLPPVRQPVV